MQYERVLELLPDYARGVLSGADADGVRLAIEQSPSLREQYEKLRAYYAALETAGTIRAPGDFLDKVNKRIDSRRGFFARVFLPAWPKLPLELAGLGVAAILTVLVFNPFTLKNVPDDILKDSGSVAPSAPSETLSPQAPAPSVSRAPERKPESADRSRKAPKADMAVEPAPRRAAARPTPPAAVSGAAARADDTPFAPEPPPAPSYAQSPRDMESVAQAAPSAAPHTQAAETAGGADISLERRKLKKESEAVSVMTLAINSRSIDLSDVAGKKGRTRARAETAEEKSSASAGAPAAPPLEYASAADKAFALVEQIVRKHGGTLTLRSTISAPDPQRTYVVALARESFEPFRADLAGLGALKDLDLNLDASSAERVTFRLGVSVK